MYVRLCKKCLEEKPIGLFALKHSIKGRKYKCWTCNSCSYKRAKAKWSDADKKKRQQACADWLKKNKAYNRYKGYLNRDKQKGQTTISWEKASVLMDGPCFYCSAHKCEGLDRIDNALGHSENNVRACCSKCNNILGDIPDLAKLCLVEGLTKIQQQGYLKEWQIPTQRK